LSLSLFAGSPKYAIKDFTLRFKWYM